MLIGAHFHDVARRVGNLLKCDIVCLFIGCPEPELRHPLLDFFASTSYSSLGIYCSRESHLASDSNLLNDEHIRGLCDIAVQTRQLQSLNTTRRRIGKSIVRSIAAVPLEQSEGMLGLCLLADTHANAFLLGEGCLLSHYLPHVADSLEQSLHNGQIPEPLLQIIGEPSSSQTRELDRLKNEFISMVSHELRAPLTSIKGYASLLQAYGIPETLAENDGDGMTPLRQKQYLDIIMEQSGHLEVLINDLLDVSRIHAGRLALRCTQINVSMLCSRVVQLMQQRVDSQQSEWYDIRCLFSPELPLIWADPDRMQQVLVNLLENAVKYSPSGGIIEVLVTTQAMHSPNEDILHTAPVSGQEAVSEDMSRMISITIRDQGVGISHEQQSQLFMPFTRLEQSSETQVHGSGLGLYITRKLVEAMGGSVSLQSSEGKGTSVTFILPVEAHSTDDVALTTPLTHK